MATLSTHATHFTHLHSYDLTPKDRKELTHIWRIEKMPLFDECIFSWNGKRPVRGKWTFWLSLHQGEWSPWILYAEWAPHSQRTFQYASYGSFIETHQDLAYPKDGECDGFQVKVCAEGGADLSELDTLHVSLSLLSKQTPCVPQQPLTSVVLPNVKGISQFQLGHPRASDLCSPTATSVAINYLSGKPITNPNSFAATVHDSTFDIYGNWILNTAQAYMELGGRFRVMARRLNHFSFLHAYLCRALPVIVSVRGPLAGASGPLTFGHLMCVIGYQAEQQKVLCADSGFADNQNTLVQYDFKDFVEAWSRRNNLAYIFEPKTIQASLECISHVQI